MYEPEGPDHQTTNIGPTGSTTTTTTTTTTWLHLDKQGTIRAVTDSTGNTIAAASYNDYGNAEPASGTVYTGSKGNSPATGAASGQISKLDAGPSCAPRSAARRWATPPRQ
jgi:hypothetical protein